MAILELSVVWHDCHQQLESCNISLFEFSFLYEHFKESLKHIFLYVYIIHVFYDFISPFRNVIQGIPCVFILTFSKLNNTPF